MTVHDVERRRALVDRRAIAERLAGLPAGSEEAAVSRKYRDNQRLWALVYDEFLRGLSAEQRSAIAPPKKIRKLIFSAVDIGAKVTACKTMNCTDADLGSGVVKQRIPRPGSGRSGGYRALVFFRRSDVISAGDAFTPDRYPMIDLARGGSIEGMLAGINYILELAVPDINEEGGTMIVPGHGRLCDESDVSDYRDMVTIVRDRVADMVKRKMTLEQVKAAKATRDYDGVYATPGHTGDMFVEAVYRSLTSQAGARPR